MSNCCLRGTASCLDLELGATVIIIADDMLVQLSEKGSAVHRVPTNKYHHFTNVSVVVTGGNRGDAAPKQVVFGRTTHLLALLCLSVIRDYYCGLGMQN